MKKFIKSIIVLLFCSAGIAYGQSPPPSVSIDGKDYYRHGYNSTSGGTVQHAAEVRDSVTITSVMKYFVLPDPTVSPLYSTSDLLNFTDVNSTFQWSLSNDPAIIGTTNGSTTPIVSVTWSSLGVDTLRALEIPNMSAVCADSGTIIPVAVIEKPTVAFTPVNSIYADSACYTQAQVDLGILITFDLNVFTRSWLVEVDYEVTHNGSPISSLNGTAVSVVDDEIDIIFPDYGRYEITLTKVTDNISRKSTDSSGNPIEGDITAVGEKFTYIVMPPVETGPIYRLPNLY